MRNLSRSLLKVHFRGDKEGEMGVMGMLVVLSQAAIKPVLHNV
jgi:hypothetical protein